MYSCRVAVFVLLFVFTTAAVCSSLFPVFRMRHDQGKDHVFYWYEESITTLPSIYAEGIRRIYTRDYGCDVYATYFVIVCIMSIVGTVCGGIATFLSLVHVTIHVRWVLVTCIAFLTFMAFACFTICTGMIGYVYSNDACVETNSKMTAYRQRGFALVEGFGLMVTACGGYLICFVLEFCT